MTVLPTIHLNGSGAGNLAAHYRELAAAAHATQEALQRATCNARDFYPQGFDAYARASAERGRIQAALAEVIAYANDWAGHCAQHQR